MEIIIVKAIHYLIINVILGSFINHDMHAKCQLLRHASSIKAQAQSVSLQHCSGFQLIICNIHAFRIILYPQLHATLLLSLMSPYKHVLFTFVTLLDMIVPSVCLTLPPKKTYVQNYFATCSEHRYSAIMPPHSMYH